MGFETEFNWALKLEDIDEKSLEKDREYPFLKKGYRTYPVGIPIDLINSSWEPCAKVVIISSENSKKSTKGIFKILRVYLNEERKFLTKYWRETVSYVKKKKIDSWDNVKVT